MHLTIMSSSHSLSIRSNIYDCNVRPKILAILRRISWEQPTVSTILSRSWIKSTITSHNITLWMNAIYHFPHGLGLELSTAAHSKYLLGIDSTAYIYVHRSLIQTVIGIETIVHICTQLKSDETCFTIRPSYIIGTEGG